MFLSCCIHVLSFCINFVLFCFHVLSCSVAMYQRYRSSKAGMLKPVRWVSTQTLTFLFIFRYCFCFSLSYRCEGLCRLAVLGCPWSQVYSAEHFAESSQLLDEFLGFAAGHSMSMSLFTGQVTFESGKAMQMFVVVCFRVLDSKTKVVSNFYHFLLFFLTDTWYRTLTYSLT